MAQEDVGRISECRGCVALFDMIIHHLLAGLPEVDPQRSGAKALMVHDSLEFGNYSS
jgi:hypothetical protein